jgi:hypothetical protein
MRVGKLLVSTVLLVVSCVANAATIYTNEALYLAALAGYGTTHESFENDAVWGASRSPSSVASTTSQGLTWKSNSFNSSTINNGDAIDGNYIFYSNPHGNVIDGGAGCEVVDETVWDDSCWQYDGWIVESAEGETLVGLGGWIDATTNDAKVTFLLDGVNVNTNRDGVFIDGLLGWTFVGVIDETGFSTVEILELQGKDSNQHHIWGDSFTVATSVVPVPAAVWLFGSGLLGLVGIARRKKA